MPWGGRAPGRDHTVMLGRVTWHPEVSHEPCGERELVQYPTICPVLPDLSQEPPAPSYPPKKPGSTRCSRVGKS